MYKQVEKPKDNKSRAVANTVAQNKNNEKQGVEFVDNRPETVAHRKLHSIVNNYFTFQSIQTHENKTGVQDNHKTGNTVQRVVQLVPEDVIVTGITHLVKMNKGSIMEGEESAELHHGTEIQIDPTDKVRSRRGPNFEIYGEFDKNREPHFRWFRVLKVGSKAVQGNLYIRDETFLVKDRRVLGDRPSRINGHGRDRMVLDDEDIYKIVEEIIHSASHVAIDFDTVHPIIMHWRSQKQHAHDPLKTYRFMQICHSLSVNRTVQKLLLSGQKGLDKVKGIVALIYSATGRQVIQEWSNDPVADIADRAHAWIFFVKGVKALFHHRALSGYLASCLEHDKGYGQTYGAASEYLLYEKQGGSHEEESFADIFRRALDESINTNIWDGGQLFSGKIATQLGREQLTEAMGTIEGSVQKNTSTKVRTHKFQEENVWIRLVTAIINAKDPTEPDYSYAQTIADNRQQVYEKVRELVPVSFDLDITRLQTVLESYGATI